MAKEIQIITPFIYSPHFFFLLIDGDFTAVTMKNVILWDIKPSSYLTECTIHLRYIAQPVNAMWISGFHGHDYEECSLFGCKNQVRTSQKTHYVSATEPSWIMLCRISGFHGGDYEECRPLGYKNSVITSHETHYVSATDPSRLKLCKS
jgi:hypothetical protein